MGIAVWRIASLFVKEAGPFSVFGHLRNLAGIRYDDDGIPTGNNVLAEALICVWCLSLWVGLVVAGAYWLWGEVVYWVTLPFALSGIAVIVEEKGVL